MTSSVIGVQCLECTKRPTYKHVDLAWKCDAYPDRIPDDIRFEREQCKFQQVQEVLKNAPREE